MKKTLILKLLNLKLQLHLAGKILRYSLRFSFLNHNIIEIFYLQLIIYSQELQNQKQTYK